MKKNTKQIKNNIYCEKAANLRTEYTALSSYFNQVVTFRITILGIYLAAVGIIVSKEQSNLIINLFFSFSDPSCLVFRFKKQNPLHQSI